MGYQMNVFEDRLAVIEHEISALRQTMEQHKPRFVQVSFIVGKGEAERLSRSRWDYIDGLGDLRVGDRVVAPRRFYEDTTGVVIAIGPSGQYPAGPWSTITKRA